MSRWSVSHWTSSAASRGTQHSPSASLVSDWYQHQVTSTRSRPASRFPSAVASDAVATNAAQLATSSARITAPSMRKGQSAVVPGAGANRTSAPFFSRKAATTGITESPHWILTS